MDPAANAHNEEATMLRAFGIFGLGIVFLLISPKLRDQVQARYRRRRNGHGYLCALFLRGGCHSSAGHDDRLFQSRISSPLNQLAGQALGLSALTHGCKAGCGWRGSRVRLPRSESRSRARRLMPKKS